MENLHQILKKSKKDVCSEMEVTFKTYVRWVKGDIPCLHLARLCNMYRFAVSDFITTREDTDPKWRETDYSLPEEHWKPVEWDSSAIGSLFGPFGTVGISKPDAAGRLGFSSHQIFDRWVSVPGILRVNDLLKMANEFRLDLNLFFKDPNAPIPMPEWATQENVAIKNLEARLSSIRQTEATLEDRNREVKRLRGEIDRLQREMRQLRSAKEAATEVSPSGFRVAERTPAYGSPLLNRGYVFHWKLWESLQEMFGMTRQEFCDAVGIGFWKTYSDYDLDVSILVNACNRFNISISHFFVPKIEEPVVHDRGYYAISPSLFTPIEDRMDNLKYLFGRYRLSGFSVENLAANGVGEWKFSSMARTDGKAKVRTLCDICTSFNIPPYIFFSDENRRKAAYAESTNERLLLNAIELARENEMLRKKTRSLEKKLKQR